MKLYRLQKLSDERLYFYGTHIPVTIEQSDLDPFPFESHDGKVPSVRELESAVASWSFTVGQEANAYRIPLVEFKAWSGKFSAAIPIYKIAEPGRILGTEQLELDFYG